MKRSRFNSAIPGALLVAALGLAGCEVEKTEEGSMPSVDVDAEGGKMPAYDVEGPDVDVSTQEKTVTVPDVEVNSEERQVTVPDVDVNTPDDDDGQGDVDYEDRGTGEASMEPVTEPVEDSTLNN